VYAADGTVVAGAVGVITTYGIQVTLPSMIYIDTIPEGEHYS
jgi:hypothetical protein